MVRLPFHRELADLFASDKSVALKLLAGAFVSGYISLRVMLRDLKEGEPAISTPFKVMLIATTAAIGMLVVLLLLLRDVVVRRVRQGQSVNPLLRAYFGQGNGCLMLALWFVTVIVATFVVTMILVSLPLARH